MAKRDKPVPDNIILFKANEKIYEDIAEDCLEKDDIDGAIESYLHVEQTGNHTPLLYRTIADLYTEEQMYNESIKYWFKYLNCVPKKNFAECYNGLGGNYYLSGNSLIASYYYNQQLKDKNNEELPFDDYMEELFGEIEEDLNLRHFSISLFDEKEKEANYIITQARTMFGQETKQSISNLLSIEPDNPLYCESRITVGAFYLLDLDFKNAANAYEEGGKEEEFRAFALNNLFPLYTVLGDSEKSEQAYNELLQKDCADFNQLTKFFMVFYQLELHKENFEFAKKVYALLPHSTALKIYLGSAAFNIGLYDLASEYFLSYYKITNDPYAKYCLNKATRSNHGASLDFSTKIPPSEYDNLETRGLEFQKQIKKTKQVNEKEFFQYADICFATDDTTLQSIALESVFFLNNENAQKYYKQLLINPHIENDSKALIISRLVLMRNDKLTGVVLNNIYSRIQFEHVEFTEINGDAFFKAYAFAFGQIAIIADPKELFKLKVSAYDLYYKLLKNGNIVATKNISAIEGAIILQSKINSLKLFSDKELCSYVGTTENKAKRLILQSQCKL